VILATSVWNRLSLMKIIMRVSRDDVGGKGCGAYLVVIGPSIICFINSIAACGVGWLNGVAMYSGAGSNGFLASANHCPD
jgi:hypothetical protein